MAPLSASRARTGKLQHHSPAVEGRGGGTCRPFGTAGRCPRAPGGGAGRPNHSAGVWGTGGTGLLRPVPPCPRTRHSVRDGCAGGEEGGLWARTRTLEPDGPVGSAPDGGKRACGGGGVRQRRERAVPDAPTAGPARGAGGCSWRPSSQGMGREGAGTGGRGARSGAGAVGRGIRARAAGGARAAATTREEAGGGGRSRRHRQQSHSHAPGEPTGAAAGPGKRAGGGGRTLEHLLPARACVGGWRGAPCGIRGGGGAASRRNGTPGRQGVPQRRVGGVGGHSGSRDEVSSWQCAGTRCGCRCARLAGRGTPGGRERRREGAPRGAGPRQRAPSRAASRRPGRRSALGSTTSPSTIR